jgi:hypothetical protein
MPKCHCTCPGGAYMSRGDLHDVGPESPLAKALSLQNACLHAVSSVFPRWGTFCRGDTQGVSSTMHRSPPTRCEETRCWEGARSSCPCRKKRSVGFVAYFGGCLILDLGNCWQMYVPLESFSAVSNSVLVHDRNGWEMFFSYCGNNGCDKELDWWL